MSQILPKSPTYGNPTDTSSLSHLSPYNTQPYPSNTQSSAPSPQQYQSYSTHSIDSTQGIISYDQDNVVGYDTDHHPSSPNYNQYHSKTNTSSYNTISDDDSFVSVSPTPDIENERLADEQKRAVRHYTRRLLYSTSLLVVPFALVAFTWFWWSTLFILTAMGCVVVYQRARPDHSGRAAMFYFLVLIANEIRSFSILIYYLSRVVSASPYTIVVMVALGFDIAVASPVNMYFAFWLHRSHQMGLYFG